MHRGILGAVGLLLIALAWPAAAQLSCNAGQTIDQSLPQGGRWQLCWREDERAGIVLSDIRYTAPGEIGRRVLAEASLAEVYLAAHDGSRRSHLLSDYGFGGENALDILADDCPNGTLLGSGGLNLLCQTVAGRGYQYKYYSTQRQGYWLELLSHAQTGEQLWIVRWRFFDDGTIEPAIALGGRLSDFTTNTLYGGLIDADGTVGVALTLRYFWRLDFDIAGNGSNDLIEEITTIPSSDRSRKTIELTALNQESARTFDEDLKRSWRVRDTSLLNADQRPISYHIEPLRTGYRYPGAAALAEDWSQFDLYVTRNRPCERFLNDNDTTNGCGLDIGEFVDGEGLSPGSDLVVWFGLADALLPHREDAPVLGPRWTSFSMIPRDWTALNPFAALLETPRIAGLAGPIVPAAERAGEVVQ